MNKALTSLEEWNGKSVSFFSKLRDPPLPIPALLSPIRLFNIRFHPDGSIYTIYYGGGRELHENVSSTGKSTFAKVSAISPSAECRFSIHGSGEVRSFIRDRDEVINHLGFELRALDTPALLFSHFLGPVGEYATNPLNTEAPKSRSVVIEGLFEQSLRPIFHVFAGPEDWRPDIDDVVWHSRTKPMQNGKRLVIAVSQVFAEWQNGVERGHEFRVHKSYFI